MIRDQYKIMLAAVPEQGPAAILELADWQQQMLDRFLDQLLVEPQRRRLDEAVIENLVDVLTLETVLHLAEES
jgi:hypothetical protein